MIPTLPAWPYPATHKGQVVYINDVAHYVFLEGSTDHPPEPFTFLTEFAEHPLVLCLPCCPKHWTAADQHVLGEDGLLNGSVQCPEYGTHFHHHIYCERASIGAKKRAL